MTDNKKIEEYKQRYFAAAHAMQSGVAMKMNYDDESTNPKHIRVGINSALVDGSAVARLLMKKGIFTEEEYFESLAVAMEEEAKSYEKEINDRFGPGGPHITLA